MDIFRKAVLLSDTANLYEFSYKFIQFWASSLHIFLYAVLILMCLANLNYSVC